MSSNICFALKINAVAKKERSKLYAYVFFSVLDSSEHRKSLNDLMPKKQNLELAQHH